MTTASATLRLTNQFEVGTDPSVIQILKGAVTPSSTDLTGEWLALVTRSLDPIANPAGRSKPLFRLLDIAILPQRQHRRRSTSSSLLDRRLERDTRILFGLVKLGLKCHRLKASVGSERIPRQVPCERISV